MINVTNSAIVEKIKGTGRTFTLSIVVGSNTYTTVKSLKRSSIFASSQKLSVGETVSAFIEAEIQNCRQSLQNYEVQPKLTIDGYTFNLGYFKVQAPSQADGSGTQKITAYDRMAETSKYTYKATGLTSAKSTFSAICSICGYTAVTSGLTDVSINDRLLDGMDCRKALGYIAGIFGKNCVVGTDGKFKMVGYSTVSESVCKISIDSLDTLEFPSQISTIDYFNAVVNDETAYKSGTGNNGVNVVNPLFTSITQTSNILTNLKSSVGGNGYYPAKFKQLNGDPRIEVGDVIKVEHRDISTGGVTADYVPVMSLTLDYDGGVTVSIEAYPTEDEFSMSLSDKVDFTNSSNNAKLEDINNKVDGFEEGIKGANTKADFATVRANAVEELNDLISNSLGLYRTEIEGTGGDIKYYFHNAEDISESNYIVAFTDKGFSVTNDWNNGNPSWSYGMNPAGNSIMNYLVVNKISADLIEAGVIRSLDGAPVNTEFSLNTGLFSLESNSQKELFGFGTNRYNHLLLQYNYSDGQKNNIKLGYYYGGQFYKNSGHTEIIPPNEKYYYGDMLSGNFYQYSSNRYTVMNDLTDVLKTYKGFILHSCGGTVGYDPENSFGFVSDFNMTLEALGGNLGIVEDIEKTPEARTPILKFYDFEKESSNGSDHYTAIRKQSIVTKHLGAETFCFYLNGKVTDLETTLLTLISSAEDYKTKIEVLETNIQGLETTITDLNEDLNTLQTAVSVLPDYKTRIESLEKAVTQLNELLGVKVLSVYVIANPTEGGSVSGSGSYTIDDREVLIEATANAGYFISSVKFVYASDGKTTTEQYNESKTNYGVYWTVLPERLGDTLNVFVNFERKEVPKYTISTSVSPSGSGSVSGGGSYENGATATLSATAHSGYQFKKWSDGNTSNPRTITVNGNASYTAVFETIVNKYTLTLIVDPTDGGSVSGGGTYESGAEATIKATANTGYTFGGWYEGERLITKNTQVTLIIDNNRTITAKFNLEQGGVLSDGDTITEGVEAYVEIPSSQSKVYLKFKPNYSGSYTFESLDQEENDPYGYVYNADKSNSLAQDRNTGGFSVSYDNFVAGNTYWLAAELYNGTGNLKVKVSYNSSSGGGDDEIYYTVKTAVSPSGAGTVTGAGKYPTGTQVECVATPSSNEYTIKGWIIKYDDTGEENKDFENIATSKIGVSLDKNTTVTALFKSTSSGGGSGDGMTVKVSSVDATVDDKIQIYECYEDSQGIWRPNFSKPIGTTVELTTEGQIVYCYAEPGAGRKITKCVVIVDGIVVNEIPIDTTNGYGRKMNYTSGGNTYEIKFYFA